jgi:cyclase
MGSAPIHLRRALGALLALALLVVPLTVGGGITNIEHIFGLMHCGADKISLNQAALHQPALLREAAKQFGAQCVVTSIDALKVDGSYYVYDYLQRNALSTTPAELARQAQEQGAGEILINSVERDGAKCSFDLQLINDVCAAVTVPVISCGGAGKPQHFIDVLESTPASGVAAANFFHFTEHSVSTTKALIKRKGLPVRHESYAGYINNSFDDAGRLLKKTDTELEELLYRPVTREVI